MSAEAKVDWGATPCIEDRPCPRVRPTLNYIIPSLYHRSTRPPIVLGAGIFCRYRRLHRPATVRQIAVCSPKTAEFMPVTFPQLNCAGKNTMFKRIERLARKQRPPKRRTQPPPEEDLGGGDICSLQEQPSTDDDQPLD